MLTPEISPTDSPRRTQKPERPERPDRPERNSRGVHSQPLAVLNEQAKTRTFSLDDVDWKIKFDETKRWIPDPVVSLSFLPAFQSLSPANQLKINQLASIGICEQFVWFEEDLLVTALEGVLKADNLEADLKLCLTNFVKEERRHSAMFHGMLEKFDPDHYLKNRFHLVKLNFIQKFIFDRVVQNPKTLLPWIWIAIFFEERTLHVSQLYRKAHGTVDESFARVHALHMIDEARHLQIDQYLLDAFYDPAPRWKKRLSAWLCYKIFSRYRSPKRIAERILNRVIEMNVESQDLAEVRILKVLKKQLPMLRDSASFSEQHFGPKVLPRTRELMAQYPEMKRVYLTLFGN